MSYITQTDLKRMRESVQEIDSNETSIIDKKAHLKKLSNDKVKNWPNTLEATRRKKEAFLKDKHEREELERQEIDRQEAEIRKIDRINTIKRANELMYAQKDKMKLLKSQALFCDVIADRDKQVIEVQQRKQASKVVAQKDHENILKTVKELEEIELNKIIKQQEAIKEVAKVRQQQLLDAKARKDAEIEEQRQIGLAMKRLAEQRLQEDIQLHEAKTKMTKQRNFEFLQANEDLKTAKAEIKHKEKLAAEARNAELELIESRKLALKELERVKFERAQVTRKLLIDRALENLKNFTSNEEAILQKQIAEATAKEDKKIADKERNRQEQLKLLAEARENQINQRDLEWKKQRDEESSMVSLWRKEYDEFKLHEEAKKKESYDNDKKYKQSLLAEAHYHQKTKIEEKLKQIEYDKFLEELAVHEDDKFIERAKETIDIYSKAGKTIYPLQKALATTTIELLPAKTVKINK